MMTFGSSDSGEITAGALAVMLDCIPTPAFLLAPDGRIIHLNSAGTRLLGAGGALRKVQSRLVARRSKEAKALAGLIGRVAASQCTELFRLLSRDGTVRLLITVRPVPATTWVAPCVADLQADRSGIATWLQQAFDLSPQNAELAESLMFGLSLSEFSADKHITMGATRTRLKKLFARTGKSSQTALVSALLRAAAIAPHSCVEAVEAARVSEGRDPRSEPSEQKNPKNGGAGLGFAKNSRRKRSTAAGSL